MIKAYITYEEYQSLGGKLSQTDFPLYERKAQRELDYITFNRIPLIPNILEEVKEVLTEFIDLIFSYEKSGVTSYSASKYSNGVETIEFNEKPDASFSRSLTTTAYKILPDYLTTRSVNFDITKYLQSDNNCTE